MKKSSFGNALTAVDIETGNSPRLMAFTTAREIRPLSEEELDQVAGAGAGGGLPYAAESKPCTGTNPEGTLCVEFDV